MQDHATLPAWYHPSSPLGSAVRGIAALSPIFCWVSGGGKACVGTRPADEQTITVLPVLKGQRQVAEIEIAWDMTLAPQENRGTGQPPAELEAAKKIVAELGDLWCGSGRAPR